MGSNSVAGAREAKNLEIRQARKSFQALERAVTQEVDGAVDQAQTAWKLASLYRDQFLPLAESSLDLSRESYRAGKAPFLTVLEAQMCGTWAISYGWGVGHISLNNRAYERFGLADVATSPEQLRAALGRRLAAPRPRDHSFAALPSAADEVLALLRRR